MDSFSRQNREPDPRDPARWRSMFDRERAPHSPQMHMPSEFETAAAALGEMEPQEPPELDSPEYKPWIIQRGRPAMMLHLRRMCPKSGLWLGWQLSYPHLFAAEYVGDSQLSLDFGTRMFMIEGKGLDQLARYLQQGAVLMIQEFTPKVWPSKTEPYVISAIKLVGVES